MHTQQMWNLPIEKYIGLDYKKVDFINFTKPPCDINNIPNSKF